MKSRFLKIVFVAALAVVSGVTAYHAQDKEMMSDLALANVEALARIESTNDCYGCAIYAPGICKDWGWGGCIGKYMIKDL